MLRHCPALLCLMKYTAKCINASNMLVKLKAIQIGLQSHYEKVKIKKIKYVYILMNRKAMH